MFPLQWLQLKNNSLHLVITRKKHQATLLVIKLVLPHVLLDTFDFCW